MSAAMRTVLIIALTVLVGIIGVLMFATAAQPMSGETETAQAWLEALCDGRLDDLYARSMTPDGVDATAFAAQMNEYLSTGALPQPCAAEINYNLIRTLVVSESLKERVDSVRYFGQVTLHSDESDYTVSMPLWLYHTIDGQWQVWTSFLGMTPEQPTAAGDTASVLDLNGAVLATIRVDPPVTIYRNGDETLIGVPVELQTLSKPWEYFDARLFIGNGRTQAVERADQLPDELREGFLATTGGYSPQNLHQRGTFWFRAGQIDTPMLLSFAAQVPYSGAVHAVYMEVTAEDANELTPFNPFARADLIDVTDGNPAFAIRLDMTDLLAGQMRVECTHFILITVADEWKRATDCTFPQGGWEDYLPGEQAQVAIHFVGYGITSEDQIKTLTYRRGENEDLVRYTLWERQ